MRKTRILLGVVFITSLVMISWAMLGAEEQTKPMFNNSLHFTGEGMRYWYEADDGFMQITGIPYQNLGCKNCHAENNNGCDACHLQSEGTPSYTVAQAKKMSTCLKCHSREAATLKIDQQRGTVGVHAAAGMECMDCHTAREVHGDGTFYHTMRDPRAKDAACTNCHTSEASDYPPIPATSSHTVHGDKLDCNACHVENSMSCFNCHFGVFIKTKKKPISFTGKVKDWLLLINYENKVTSATIQSLVGQNNEPFIIYTPYYTHSIMSQGRKCEACHANDAVREMVQGRPIGMAEFGDGVLKWRKGVVPVVPELLGWPFMEKVDDQWRPFKPMRKPLIQMGLGGTALTQEQLDSLNEDYTYE